MHAKLARVTLGALMSLLFNAWPSQAEISSVTLKTSRNVSFF